MMHRTAWRCRNPGCLVPHGATLGSRTPANDLELAASVDRFVVELVVGRALVRCPACGVGRTFRGGSVFSARR